MNAQAKKKVIFPFIVCSLVIISSMLGYSVILETEYSTVDFTITFATYLDLDGTGVEDDIYANATIDLNTTKNNVAFTFDIYLILPSGYTYEHRYCTNLDHGNYIFDMYFYNHATEPGWYELIIDVTLIDSQPVRGREEFIFDPPGEKEGTNPPDATFTIS